MGQKKELNPEVYGKITELLTENSKIRAALQYGFRNPKEYFEANEERYDERCLDWSAGAEDLMWFAIIDELLEVREMTELDWKAELDWFVDDMNELGAKYGATCEESWFDEDEDVSVWVEELNARWTDHRVGQMEIDSDSYVLFVTDRETAKELEKLALSIGQHIS